VRYRFGLIVTKGSTGQSLFAEKGEHCTFSPSVRYSQLVINSRINDFKANTKAAGFGVFDGQGHVVESPQGQSSTLDYVPGLVAKAILEAVDYYQYCDDMDVAPWYYAIEDYANRCDITSNGKNGKSFDDLNAVKLYFKLSTLTTSGRFAEGPTYTRATTLANASKRFSDALKGIVNANKNYVIKASTLPDAAGGWWHKSSYVNQMWCDGQYMGPALLAQLINEYEDYQSMTADDWALLVSQFSISWHFLWNEEVGLLYHAFTADPSGSAAKDWVGVSAQKGSEVYHSAEYWGRAIAWYFLALVDVLEQMEKAGLSSSDGFAVLHDYLQLLAAGVASKQDAASGCWYQLINHDASFVAQRYDSSYRYTSDPVANYLESSCTAIFIAAYLKAVRLHFLSETYTALACKAYQGFVEHFMVADGEGGVHLIGSCKSAGLGGSNYRDGSAEYYLMGKDTKPTSTSGSDFYTEGKVLGGFILAAVEYERICGGTPTLVKRPSIPDYGLPDVYTLGGWRQQEPVRGIYIKNRKCILR
jgi:rhamnogalacturonyl hydrolase YesR